MEKANVSLGRGVLDMEKKTYKPSDKLISILKEMKIEKDEIDWASYSGDIPIEEWLKNEYSIIIRDYKEMYNQVKEAMKKQKDEEQKRLEEEEIKLIESFKNEKAKEVNIDSFSNPQHFIRMVCRGHNNACLLIGEAGIGKSFLTINTIKQELKAEDYIIISGYITPLSLYITLYKNRDKVIVFDDCRGLFENPNAVAILKPALWSTGTKRIVTYETTSKHANEVPSAFECNSRFIILGNKLNIKDENIRALVNRALYWDFNFTFNEKCSIMRKVAETPYKKLSEEQRLEVAEFLIANTNPAVKDFSFRTLIKGYDFKEYDGQRWKDLLKSILKTDENKQVVWELKKKIESKEIKKSEAVKMFIDYTGMCRKSWFNLSKEVGEV